MTEIVNQEVSKEVEQGKTPQQISTEFSQKNPNIPKDEVNFTFNQAAMDEGECITKRQIREAKIKKLQENCVRYTKKDLR